MKIMLSQLRALHMHDSWSDCVIATNPGHSLHPVFHGMTRGNWILYKANPNTKEANEDARHAWDVFHHENISCMRKGCPAQNRTSQFIMLKHRDFENRFVNSKDFEISTNLFRIH
jgi:hypothetical protein